ncbi:MAG: hypothetical protein GKC10_09525 [Methanosarcinales archaeon]|nr:hypothetical protein [Methanosarcinales archaeon]
MARELNRRDVEILGKLAPELQELICQGSGLEFRSILPPVSNHFARDDLDLAKRLERLSVEELQYISALVEDGSESLGCLAPEAAEVFFQVLRNKISPEAAERARVAYELGGCD